MAPQTIGRYEVRSELGRGGMATVYRGFDPRFKREVAIKILPREFLHDPNFRARFEREAEVVAGLEHAAIVPVYDYGEDPDSEQPYLVMRLMTGGSLADRLAKGALSVIETARIFSRIAPALDLAHSKGIIHRDLKPGNILFDGSDNPYISDFGIAKLTAAATTFTGSGVVGTPAYMSPEQARGDKHIDGRSDIYALGAMVYEMLTGQSPYEAETPVGLILKHVSEPVPDIMQTRPDLPHGCDDLIHKSMAKHPDERYGRAAEMSTTLEAIAAGDYNPTELSPTLVGELPVTERVATKPSPQRKSNTGIWVGVIGFVIVALIAAGGAGLVGMRLFLPRATPSATIVAVVSPPTLTTAPTQSKPTVRAPTATPQKIWTYQDMTVGFIQTGSEGAWRVANTASFKETAQQLGIHLKFYDAQNNLEDQVSAFHQFNQDPEVDVIILAALETTGWEEVLKEAQAAGKVVIIEDHPIDAPDDLYATYIGSDFVEEGRKSAVEMCKLLEGSEKKNVWMLIGNVGSSAAQERGQGFKEKMGDCGIQITKEQTANWSITEGKQVTAAWLKETRDVQAIYAQNDEMGLGAIEALKEAGLRPGVDVKILSIDATSGAFKAMIAGDLNVTVECNPLLAPQVYEAALKALNGETLPKWVPSQEGVFYQKDAEAILPTRKY